MPTTSYNLSFSGALQWAFLIAFGLWVVTEILLVAPGVLLLGNNRDRGSAVAIIASVGVGVSLAMGLAQLRIGAFDAGWLQWVGVALMLGGIGWRHYVVRYLGRFFTPLVTVQDGQRVVKSGPFRLVRHPSYLGTLLTMIGFGLALGSWAALLTTVFIAAPAYIYRMRVEEAAMLDAFGEEYCLYAASTRRIVPFIW